MNMMIFHSTLSLLLGFFSVQMKANGTEVNIARGGTADQSTSFFNWYAQNALDGLSSTCTHTDLQSDPWWKLDLMKTYSVNRVTITNRPDCCGNRIDGAEIRIGNDSSDLFTNPVCAVVSNIPEGATYSYSCRGMEGRYIFVNIPGTLKILTLCEVGVYEIVPGIRVRAHGLGCPYDPLLKKTFVKIKMKTSLSLSEPAVRVQLLSQLQSALAKRGISDVTLQWSQLPTAQQEVMWKEDAPAQCARGKR